MILKNKAIKRILCAAVSVSLIAGEIFLCSLSAKADVDYMAEAENRKSLPIQTNSIANWPAGPAIGAEAAILIEANTGTILYAKNIDEELYPASTTKIMTCLLAIENCQLDETVTFSHEAVYSIERGSSNIGMDEGQAITMQQALQGILILSANEVANAVGEHVAGSSEEFVKMMNDRVEEMGLEHTHFANPHGLYRDDHYTSAYDLAMIAREFFSHEVLATISNTPICTFEATPTQPDSFSLRSKNMLTKGGKYEYPYLCGSKTGYTSEARQTLVSCAQKNNMKLICVILKEESPYQFTDTVALFNYGFDNFTMQNIAENEKSYSVGNSGYSQTGTDIFGENKEILSLSDNSYVCVPSNVSFDALESSVTYDTDYENAAATVNYTYNGVAVGSAYVTVSSENTELFAYDRTPSSLADVSELSEQVSEAATNTSEDVGESESEAVQPTTNKNATFINVKHIVLAIAGVVLAAIIVFVVRGILKDYQFAKRRRAVMSRKKRNKRGIKSEFEDFKF